MFDYLLNEKQKILKQEAGQRNLMGCRYPKKFVTESCQRTVHNAMQVMGGIGYTNIYPVERIFRDLRLASIWTGTNEVISMIIANEWYKECWENKKNGKICDMELDADEAEAKDEKIFE